MYQRWLLAGCACAFLVAGLARGQAVVHIAPAAHTGPPWMGLGIEFDPYSNPPGDARWQMIEQRLDAMRPGFFRVMLDGTDYCAGFGAQGKPRYAWQPGESGDAALQARWHEVRRVLGYAQSRGVRVLLGLWSPPGPLGITTPSDPRYAAMLADLTAYLRTQDHDTVISNVIFMNEPNGQWMWRHGAPDYASWLAGERNLRSALNERALTQVGIAGPDNSGDTPWFDRTVKDSPALFAAWESHIYATDDEVLSGRILSELRAQSATIAADDPAGAGKERFLAESGLQTGKNNALDQQPRVHDFNYGVLMADYVVQVAEARWLGADAWDLDDAMHTNAHGGLKIWGFWDSTSDAGMTPRPWFYAWSMLSRALPRGASLEDASGAPAGVRVTAAHYGASGESVVLVNVSGSAAILRVSDAALRGDVQVQTYAGSGSPADGGRFAEGSGLQKNISGAMTVHVPPHSVMALVAGVP